MESLKIVWFLKQDALELSAWSVRKTEQQVSTDPFLVVEGLEF